jgi:hypothetical protein
MTRTDAAIAGAIVLGIGLLGVDTSLAFEQAWRPASMAPAASYAPGAQPLLRMPHFRPVVQRPRAVVRDHGRMGSLTQPRSLRPTPALEGRSTVVARAMPDHGFNSPGYRKAVRPQWRIVHRSPMRNVPGTPPTVAGSADRRRPAAGVLANQGAATNTRGSVPFGRHTTAQRGSRVFAPIDAMNQEDGIGTTRPATVIIGQARAVQSASWRPSVKSDERRGVVRAQPPGARSTGHLGGRTSAVTPSAYPGSPMPAWNARWRPAAQAVAPVRTMQSQFRPPADRILGVSTKRPSQLHAKPLHRPVDRRPPAWATTYEVPFGRARCVWCNGG